MKHVLPLAIAAAVLSGCGDRATPIRISNESSFRVWDLRIRGDGFEAYVGLLGPGESIDIDVYPAGETGIALEFWTASGEFEVPQDGYMEGGGMYSARVRIAEDLSVDVVAGTWPLLAWPN